jgi:hypothetical protein
MEEVLQATGLLLSAFVLAWLDERIVQAIFDYPIKKAGLPDVIKLYAGLVVGVLMCFGFRVDLLAEYFALFPDPAVPWLGYLLSGLVVGGGSSQVHDLANRFVWKRPTPNES